MIKNGEVQQGLPMIPALGRITDNILRYLERKAGRSDRGDTRTDAIYHELLNLAADARVAVASARAYLT
jgi:hypothetical protein